MKITNRDDIKVHLLKISTEQMIQTVDGKQIARTWDMYRCMCGDGRIVKLHDDDVGAWAIVCDRCVLLWRIEIIEGSTVFFPK